MSRSRLPAPSTRRASSARRTCGLEVSALGPLTEAFGQRLEGRLSLEADLSLASAEQIEIDLTGRAQDLAGLPPGAAELLGPEPRLTALASLSPAAPARGQQPDRQRQRGDARRRADDDLAGPGLGGQGDARSAQARGPRAGARGGAERRARDPRQPRRHPRLADGRPRDAQRWSSGRRPADRRGDARGLGARSAECARRQAAGGAQGGGAASQAGDRLSTAGGDLAARRAAPHRAAQQARGRLVDRPRKHSGRRRAAGRCR